jgi:alanyl-tRNA synthetase
MALHTGQHMLSRALVDEARAETVSSRLGESSCTIDVDLDKLADGDVARAEALVNAIVDDDVPVRAWFPEAGELAALPLRRAPKVDADIRVVAIGDFDVSPCGGTHCLRSAQVGLVRVTGLERYKGKMRVSFAAGRRARAELAGHADVLAAMAREMTCGPSEVPAGLAKLRRELAGAREALGQARTRLGLAAADELIRSARARGETLLVAEVPDADAELLRAICKRITAEPDLAVFAAAPSGDGLHLLCARGAASTVDCGALLKRVTQAAGGRGGGSPERAEGRAPAGTDLQALVTRP